jgi:hypothetical protein
VQVGSSERGCICLVVQLIGSIARILGFLICFMVKECFVQNVNLYIVLVGLRKYSFACVCTSW